MNTRGSLKVSKRTGTYSKANIRRRANQIANTIEEKNCEIVKVSKGKKPVTVHKIVGNQIEILAPAQVPIERLVFLLESILKDRKKVKIEIVGYKKHRRKESVHVYKCPEKMYLSLLKKGDDDGTGTSSRRGKVGNYK